MVATAVRNSNLFQGAVTVKIVEPSFEVIEDQLEKLTILDSVYLP